jgi:hypothetical protein
MFDERTVYMRHAAREHELCAAGETIAMILESRDFFLL